MVVNMNSGQPIFEHLAAVDIAIIVGYFSIIVFLGFYLRRRAASGSCSSSWGDGFAAPG